MIGGSEYSVGLGSSCLRVAASY